MASRAFETAATAALAAAIAGANAARRAGVTTAELASWSPFRCPLKLFFGVDCPTCGLGRALIAACAGCWAESWRFHPGGALLLSGACLYLAARWAVPERMRALSRASAARGLVPERVVAAFVGVSLALRWVSGFAG